VIYVISKKYVGEKYAFLASCFFMFQGVFLWTEYNARTNIAVLFFALAMMVLFSDKIDPLKKRLLFIVFMASCIVSHYSTSYIFFFIMLGAFMGMEILSKKYTAKKVVSLTIIVLFFAFIFFWYSQVTETAFDTGVSYAKKTLISLNMFFIAESRRDNVQVMFGKDIRQEAIPRKIEFMLTWLSFAFIAIGVITVIRRYKEMSFPELNFKKPDFLKNKFEVSYVMIALACAGMLVAIVALPFISKVYGMERLYAVAITILSVFFVIGGITLSKHFFFFKKKTGAKRKPWFFGKVFFSKEGFERKNTSQQTQNTSEVRAYLVILLVLIPHFFCVTGVTSQMFGVRNAIILNSEGEQYDMYYVHDQESYGAKWLKSNADEKTKIYADFYGNRRLASQGRIASVIPNFYGSYHWISAPEKINGYIYLRYSNILNEKMTGLIYNMTDYLDTFTKKS
jgi:uncharacterized membrane protein